MDDFHLFYKLSSKVYVQNSLALYLILHVIEIHFDTVYDSLSQPFFAYRRGCRPLLLRWLIWNDWKLKRLFIGILIHHFCLNRLVFIMMLVYLTFIGIFFSFIFSFNFFPYEILDFVFPSIPHSFSLISM